MNKNKIAYLASTGLLSLMMLLSAGMYVFNYAEISEVFLSLGFPTFIIYPLAAAKVLGLVAIWTRKSEALKEWAYAGFFFDFTLAFFAHIVAQDGEQFGALIAMILLGISYFFGRKTFGEIAAEEA